MENAATPANEFDWQSVVMVNGICLTTALGIVIVSRLETERPVVLTMAIR